METEFAGYKVTAHCRPKIRRLHNMRDRKITRSESHIDKNGRHETILDLGTLEEAYEQIFGEAVKKFNAKQKRKDRMIGSYLQKILSDTRRGKHKNATADGSRKPAYEMVLQIGNRDICPDHEESAKILKDFCKFLTEKYPNIVPIGIFLHDDEFSIDSETGERVRSPVHIHFDFVYVAHLGKSLRTGMELQSSMSAALSEMGFVTQKGKGTAQTQFEEAVRHDLQNFAEWRGMQIDRTPGERHSHQQKPVYQQMRENVRRKKLLDEMEARQKSERKELTRKMQTYNEAENSLRGREVAVERKSREADRKFSEAESMKHEAAKDKEVFEAHRYMLDFYKEAAREIKDKHLAIDSETRKLMERNSRPFAERLGIFIASVKKIVAGITMELSLYRTAFASFWKKKASDIRKVADDMERNGCADFADYNDRLFHGRLDWQRAERKRNAVESSMSWD